MADSIWSKNYTFEALQNTAIAGWESIWGPFTVIAAGITIITILVISMMMFWKASHKTALGIFGVGSLLAAFSWWQIYWTFFQGYWLVALISLGLISGLGLIGAKTGVMGWGTLVMLSGFIIFAMYLVLWIEPFYFDWALYPFYWSPF